MYTFVARVCCSICCNQCTVQKHTRYQVPGTGMFYSSSEWFVRQRKCNADGAGRGPLDGEWRETHAFLLGLLMPVVLGCWSYSSSCIRYCFFCGTFDCFGPRVVLFFRPCWSYRDAVWRALNYWTTILILLDRIGRRDAVWRASNYWTTILILLIVLVVLLIPTLSFWCFWYVFCVIEPHQPC